MYDSTCKFIALEYSRDLATWLLGKPLDLTEIKPSELSLEPIRADSLIFLESEELILHIEFQTDPKEDIPYRMLDYATRLYRRYQGKPIYQVVIYLRRSTLPLVRQNDYQQGKTYHQFEVIRLWEQPYQPLLQAPGLLPFAILAQAEEQENLLRQIAQKIEQISDSREQSNLAASTAILAGLVLKNQRGRKTRRSHQFASTSIKSAYRWHFCRIICQYPKSFSRKFRKLRRSFIRFSVSRGLRTMARK